MASDLLGVWQRTDGDYILKIGSADPGGTLDAAYFNPRPINVGRAVWRMTGSVLKVEVVLDDVNYQGSSYTLVYDPGRQQLEGTYFQPAYGQTFEVFFVRRPAGGL